MAILLATATLDQLLANAAAAELAGDRTKAIAFRARARQLVLKRK